MTRKRARRNFHGQRKRRSSAQPDMGVPEQNKLLPTAKETNKVLNDTIKVLEAVHSTKNGTEQSDDRGPVCVAVWGLKIDSFTEVRQCMQSANIHVHICLSDEEDQIGILKFQSPADACTALDILNERSCWEKLSASNKPLMATFLQKEPVMQAKRKIEERCRPLFFYINQHVGTETKETEFKMSEINLKSKLCKYVREYGLAFLNLKGGVLYIGVNDTGRVLGIECSNDELDTLANRIDQGLTDIYPPLRFEIDCFCDLLRVYDYDTGLHIKDTYVIRIEFKQGLAKQMYYSQASGLTYLRYNASNHEVTEEERLALNIWRHDNMPGLCESKSVEDSGPSLTPGSSMASLILNSLQRLSAAMDRRNTSVGQRLDALAAEQRRLANIVDSTPNERALGRGRQG